MSSRSDWILRALERQRGRDPEAWVALVVAFGAGVVFGLWQAGAL